MDETTTATAAAGTHVDEQARFRAFVALAVSLTALAGGGVFSGVAQWLMLRYAVDANDDRFVMTFVAVMPVVLGAAAVWLSLGAAASRDPLARPLGRATTVLGALSVAGGVALALITLAGPWSGQA